MSDTLKGWHPRGYGQRAYLADENGRIVGEVSQMFGGSYAATAKDKSIGAFITESSAKSAVEKEVGTTLGERHDNSNQQEK